MAKSEHIQQAEIDSFKFKWTIRNFSLYTMKDVGYCIKSPTFSCRTGFRPSSKWYINVYPNGHSKENENYLSLFLCSACKATIVTVKYKFSILNTEGEKFHESELKHEFDTNKADKPGYGWPNFIKTLIILDRANGLLPDDTLTICCKIKYPTNIAKNTAKKALPECRLSDNLNDLFGEKWFSDVTLTAQGEEFKVHRNILTARSSVFAAMFLSDMKEKNQDVIEIVDMSEDVLRAMLSFIYSGEALDDESTQLTSDLLVAADKYDLERLKVMCEKSLCMKLNVENACDLLVVADLHNASELKATAMDFINNEISSVLTTETRMSLIKGHPYLFNEILDYHLQTDHKKDEKEDEDDE